MDGTLDPARDFDWHRGNGSTPDRTSGPDVDHTYGKQRSAYTKYVYYFNKMIIIYSAPYLKAGPLR